MSLNLSATFSSSFYLRNFYSTDRSAASTTSYRNNATNHTLLLADSKAVEKAAKKLSSLDYSTSSSTNAGDIYNTVSAFIKSYNNLMSSSGASDTTYITNKKTELKKLMKEHSDDFSAIGITVASDGKLKLDDDTFSSASLNKIKQIFYDSDDITGGLQKYAKDINLYAKSHPPVSAASATDSASGLSTYSSNDSDADSVAALTETLLGSQIDISL